MDIQARKLHLIEKLLKLQNVELLERIEALIMPDKGVKAKRFTIDELDARIDKSLEDAKASRITNGEQILKEIKKWS
ncbi:MAG: hypothetical protein ACPF8V_08850 [Luteibaculum sp.]